VESYFNSLLKKYNYVRYFICPSRFLLEKHAASGIPRDKLVHIPHFIDVSRFEPNYNPGAYILFSGRLSREKGMGTLLKAIKGLDVRLRVAGDGPMREDYESFVRANNMKNVEFLGHKTEEDLISLYRNAAFLVFPSEWYEVVGMSAIEAFACGKPAVGSGIGGITETIADGETGLLFKPGDENELRAKIEMLVNSPTMIARMGRRARDEVQRLFGPEEHYGRLMDLYRSVVS
jgi:glycosyltransferase involved in cell wall biosynthesis